jgi:hypothetical protein
MSVKSVKLDIYFMKINVLNNALILQYILNINVLIFQMIEKVINIIKIIRFFNKISITILKKRLSNRRTII